MRFSSRLIAFAILLPLLAGGCAREGVTLPKTGKTYVSWQAPGQIGLGYGPQNIHWIDDDNVLYLGRVDDASDPGVHSLRIWTLSTGRVRDLGPSIGNICYFRGYLTHHERGDGKQLVIREGSLDATTAKTVQEPDYHRSLSAQGFREHRFNCKRYQSADLAPDENCKVPLIDGDGILEVGRGACRADERRLIEAARASGRRDERGISEEAKVEREMESRPVRYAASVKGEAMDLPIEAGELLRFGGNFAYVEWMGKYALPQYAAKGRHAESRGAWPVDEYVIYLLNPGGAVERLTLPLRRHFLQSPSGILVSKVGIVLRVPGLTVDRKRTVFGIVLFRGSDAEELDDGETTQMALSPNGCRVAYERRQFLHQQKRLEAQLRVIDVCASKR